MLIRNIKKLEINKVSSNLIIIALAHVFVIFFIIPVLVLICFVFFNALTRKFVK